jgi:hypothetical protein
MTQAIDRPFLEEFSRGAITVDQLAMKLGREDFTLRDAYALLVECGLPAPKRTTENGSVLRAILAAQTKRPDVA